MDKGTKFQGLKNLHQNLHSRKGLTSIGLTNSACCTDLKQESILELAKRTESLECTSEEKESEISHVEATNNLLKAVKNVYDGNNVKLTEPKIFVGNISYKLSTSQLKEFFSTFGRVIYVQIIKDRVKKRSKGYGFVTLSNEDEVERVLQASEDELILDGRTLRINRAEKKKRSRPIRQTSNEEDPKKSLEDFVQKYMAKEEAPECDQIDTDDLENNTEVEQQDLAVVISHLNDDILLYIFMFLTIKDRVKIERGLTDRILLSLFKRGCQNLKSLDLSHSSRILTDYALYLIGQNCAELQDINLSGVNVTMRSLKEMSSRCCKLKKIKLQRCYEVGEKALWWLFKQCTELEYVDIEGNIRITGQCFFMLTEKCKTVIAEDCMKLTDSGLQQLTKRCNSLQELNISNCLGLTDVGVTDLLVRCTKLKRLSFCGSPKQVSTQSLLALRYLTQLEELELAKQDAVDDSVLFVIGSNSPQLRVLNLEACHNVTDRGIKCLTGCLQLENLVISYLAQVTDDGVETVAQNGRLRELHARSCSNLTDKAVETLVLHCPYVHELDLSGSERIRNRSLDILEEYLGDNEVMVISVGGTGITMERVLKTRECYPTWDVTTQNLSDHHLRVDFDPCMDMGRILSYYSDDDEDVDEFEGYDAQYYLEADDPSAWEYDEQWMS